MAKGDSQDGHFSYPGNAAYEVGKWHEASTPISSISRNLSALSLRLLLLAHTVNFMRKQGI